MSALLASMSATAPKKSSSLAMNETQLQDMLADIAECLVSPENRADPSKLRQVLSRLKLLKITSIEPEVLQKVQACKALRQAFGQLGSDPDFKATYDQLRAAARELLRLWDSRIEPEKAATASK